MFGDYFEKIIEQHDLKLDDLANKTGLSQGHLSMLKNNQRNPSPKTIKKLAPYLNVPIRELMEAAGHVIEQSSVDLLDALSDEGPALLAGGQPLTPDQRLAIARALDNPSAFRKTTIPILVRVPAGIPIMANGEWDGELEIPSDIEADFALQVKGDSMIGAGIHEGDYAICREAYGASSGDIVVALEDIGPEYSRGTLKYYIENGQGVLRAANPDYEDIPLGGSHRITGIMIGLIRIGSTPLSYFRDYISIRDYHLKEWNDVIEEAVTVGIEPRFVKTLIQNQIALASELARRT